MVVPLTTTLTVEGSLCAGVVVERYRYEPGPAASEAPHVHTDYQVGVSLDFPGQYELRRGTIAVPSGAVSVIPPGEVHAARDPFDRQTPATYLMLYLPQALVTGVLTEMAGSNHAREVRDLSAPVVDDPLVLSRFVRLHSALSLSPSQIAHEVELLSAIEAVFERQNQAGARRPAAVDELPSLKRVRDYLHAHIAENVSLANLAGVAGLGYFQTSRAFKATFGMAPHRYLTRIRIDEARRLLAAGRAPAEVSNAVGFADQSHFGRHFKRLVGVTPGAYSPSRKIVLSRPR